MHLINSISSDSDSPAVTVKIASLSYAALQLRNAVSRFVQVSITQDTITELELSCKYFFNCCSLLLGNVTPTVWTVGYAIPRHCKLISMG